MRRTDVIDITVTERMITHRGDPDGRYATVTIRRTGGGSFSISAAQTERIYDAAAISPTGRFSLDGFDVEVTGDAELFAFDPSASYPGARDIRN